MGSTPHPSKKSCQAALCSSIRSFKWSTAAKLKRRPCPPTSSSESLRHCWVWSAFHNETACLVVSLRRIQTNRRRLGKTEAGTSQGCTSGDFVRRARRTKSPEVGPHDLGPQHTVLGGALPQRLFHQP